MSLFDTLFKLAMPKGLAGHTLYRNTPYKQTILHKLGQLLEDGRIDAVLYHELSGIFASDKISYMYSNDEQLPYINLLMKIDEMFFFFLFCATFSLFSIACSYAIFKNGLYQLWFIDPVLLAIFLSLSLFFIAAILLFLRQADGIILQNRPHFMLERHFHTDGEDKRGPDIFIRKKARKHKSKIFLDLDQQEFLRQVKLMQHPHHDGSPHS